jgi:maltose phosphorylase
MVTITGEECHNEWEITFEEIHRNGAIAFAIANYVRYTGDEAYLADYGLEVLIAISRFWAQRVNWSEKKQLYVMLGVTGPNEYENNVNNNWYTNMLAAWCLRYTLEAIGKVKTTGKGRWQQLVVKTGFEEGRETSHWGHILANLYLPEDKEEGIFLQQDGYMDKEQLLVSELRPEELPLNQHWSWDRILRSCFIKQADVLQGLYLFGEDYDTATLKRNFNFYEPRTVHESSLSPCVHAILAARIGDAEKAYEMYLRTSRLDLDDYNSDTADGLHITSMAGTWMSIVEGFAGMSVAGGKLHFAPFLPEPWESYSFSITFRGVSLVVMISPKGTGIRNKSAEDIVVYIHDIACHIPPGREMTVEHGIDINER